MEIFLARNFINNLPPVILFPCYPRESGDPEKRTRTKWLDPQVSAFARIKKKASQGNKKTRARFPIDENQLAPTLPLSWKICGEVAERLKAPSC